MRSRLFRRGGAWWFDITDSNGKRVRQRIGKVSAETARAVLGKRTSESVEGKFLDMEGEPVKLAVFVEAEYLPWARANLRPGSWQRYEVSLKALLPAFGGRMLHEITPSDIERWRVERLKAVKASTSNRDITALKAILSRAVEWGKLKDSPARRVKLLKERNTRLVYLSDDEANRLLTAATGHLRPFLKLLLHTGLRRGEALALKWQDVDKQTGHLHVRDSKTGEARSIPLNMGASEALTDVIGLKHVATGTPFVFCDETGKPFKSVRTSFGTAMKRAGLEGKGYTLHTMRHTFASNLANLGVPVQTIAALLGHSDIRMSLRYAHLSPDARRAAVSLLDQKRDSKGTVRALEPGDETGYNSKC